MLPGTIPSMGNIITSNTGYVSCPAGDYILVKIFFFFNSISLHSLSPTYILAPPIAKLECKHKNRFFVLTHTVSVVL